MIIPLLLFVALLALVTIAIPQANQSANALRKTATRGRGTYPIANASVVYPGMFAGLKSGYLDHYDAGTTTTFLGIVLAGDDRVLDGVFTGNTSDSPPPEARVDESGPVLMHVAVGGTPSQADVGQLVYCATSNPADMTKTDNAKPPVGWLKRFRSVTDCDVQLFTPSEWLTGVASGTWLA